MRGVALAAMVESVLARAAKAGMPLSPATASQWVEAAETGRPRTAAEGEAPGDQRRYLVKPRRGRGPLAQEGMA